MDISGYGSSAQIIASTTFPTGINITQFADDIDFIDIPSLQIADKAMGGNGDLITWSKANPINLTIGVVPDGEDDINLNILFEANRVGRGKLAVQDIIIFTWTYPNGNVVTLNNGRATDYMPFESVASAGRIKSKPYSFTFENMIRS